MSKSASYWLYGLALRSPLVLPCLRAAERVGVDVRLGVGDTARFARARRELAVRLGSREWFRYRRLADGTTYLQWTGLFEFLISGDGRRILYCKQPQATLESFRVYLLGHVISFSLLAFGFEPLHGTVIVVNGEAVAFLGDCGYGKSTLAAAMLARGFPILTDDLIALNETDGAWMVHPGIPRIKLYPGVARKLLGRNVGRTPMNRGTSKLILRLCAPQIRRQAVPLRALYVLSDPRPRGNDRVTYPRIEPLFGQQAFIEVIRAAFNLLVLEQARFANQFAFATRLVASVPIRRLTYPRRLSLLPSVCDAMLADLT